jgi:hypothetical protein
MLAVKDVTHGGRNAREDALAQDAVKPAPLPNACTHRGIAK